MTTARKVRQIFGSIFFGGLIGAGLTAIAIWRGGLVHAEPSIDPAAASYAQRGGAVAVCRWFDNNGMTEKTIGAVGLAIVNSAHFTTKQSADVIIYSVLTQCTQYQSTLSAISGEHVSVGSIV